MALKDAMVKLMAALTGKKSGIIDVETLGRIFAPESRAELERILAKYDG